MHPRRWARRNRRPAMAPGCNPSVIARSRAPVVHDAALPVVATFDRAPFPAGGRIETTLLCLAGSRSFWQEVWRSLADFRTASPVHRRRLAGARTPRPRAGAVLHARRHGFVWSPPRPGWRGPLCRRTGLAFRAIQAADTRSAAGPSRGPCSNCRAGRPLAARGHGARPYPFRRRRRDHPALLIMAPNPTGRSRRSRRRCPPRRGRRSHGASTGPRRLRSAARTSRSR